MLVHQGISSVQWEDIMSTPEGYRDECGEGPWYNHWICMEPPVYWVSLGVLITSPTLITVSPSVRLVSLRCIEHCPLYWCYPLDVLSTLRCTQGIPSVLMIIFSCMEHLQCTYPSGVLKTPLGLLYTPRCTAQTLSRVIVVLSKKVDVS